MRRFHFYIDDDRYSVPTEMMVETGSEARARELAERMLGQSAHHLGVEVCEDGARVLGLGSFAQRSICGLHARRRRPASRAVQRPQPSLRGWLEPFSARQAGHAATR